MKIAIVAPLPQPFVIGGAEKLWWGLLEHLNARTPHQAELVKLPSPEADFWSLMASYERFSRLRLEGFDLVVTGKYPAWMIDHPGKVCYMLHRLRGLYDAYPGDPAVPAGHAAHPGIARLRRFMEEARGQREALDDFFGLVSAFRGSEVEPAFAFPGPLTREVVHFLDGIGLAAPKVSRFAAIARTLTRREGYFPEGTEVRVAHPPSHLPVTPGEAQEFFFTVSRLDGPKRIGLIVEAMRHVTADVPLLIAGTGPEEARLRELTRGDGRIRFLGFLNDSQVADHYRRALAVPFVPWQEDYGFVTLEAMMAGKPVVTVTDAGGPTELVEDGVNGYVVAAEPAALGERLDALARDRDLARRLGQAGIARAERVNWDGVTRALTEGLDPAAPSARPARPRIVVLATFPFHPIIHGGQARAYHLYRQFALERFDVTVVGIDTLSTAGTAGEIAPGMRQVVVTRSPAHLREEERISLGLDLPVTDVVMPSLHGLTPAIAEAVREAVRGAQAAVLCHPYLLPALDEAGWTGELWYEAQDVEIELKRSMLPAKPEAARLLEDVGRVEREAVLRASRIFACSDADADSLARLYGADRARIAVAPNGTDLSAIRASGPTMREVLRERLGLGGRHFALFIGSGHKPNIDAAASVFGAAAEMPDVTFLIVGNVCAAFDPQQKPENVVFLGHVDDATRGVVFDLANVALNPVTYGSGTNLKMLDYFAAGIPVVSTATGARGLDIADGEHFVLASVEEMPAAIRRVLDMPPPDLGALTGAARRLVEERYDWKAIARRALSTIP